MATTPEQLPHPHIPHIRLPDIKGAGRWVQDKWMPVGLSLAAAALGLTGYFIATHDGGTQNPVRPTTEVSNPSKPAEPNIGIVIPTTPIETATASPSPEPPEPTVTPTSVPKDEPTAEAIKAFDCGIFSPGACANGDYVQWGVWSPSGTVKVQGMAFTLKPGEEARITENFVVAASKYNEPGAYNGYAIEGITRDGKRSMLLIGDVEPTNGVAQAGKDFPAGTVVGIAGNTGEAVLPGLKYNLLVILPTEEDLKKTFPDQTKKPPIIIKNEILESAPKPPPPKPPQGGGAIFFDVTPPKAS